MNEGIIQKVFKQYKINQNVGLRTIDVYLIEQELIEEINQEFKVQLPYIGYNVSDDIKILKHRIIGDVE